MKRERELIYDKVIAGAHLTDDEVNKGVTFFKDLSDSLYDCGPIFRLPATEAYRIYRKLYEYQQARLEKSQRTVPLL